MHGLIKPTLTHPSQRVDRHTHSNQYDILMRREA